MTDEVAIRQFLDAISKEQDARIHSYSGVDIRVGVLVPFVQDPRQKEFRRVPAFKPWAELQTLTFSSERPAGPVRVLGSAAPRDHVRGPRTIAGSMIFSVLDRDVFADFYAKNYDREAPADYPCFVDMIPEFHIVISALNEFGSSASCAIMGVTLTNMGTTYSIDDLMLEATYTYVARFVHPFMDRTAWRSEMYKFVWNVDSEPRVSKEGPRGIEIPASFTHLR